MNKRQRKKQIWKYIKPKDRKRWTTDEKAHNFMCADFDILQARFGFISK